jgi:hypothetical protein
METKSEERPLQEGTGLVSRRSGVGNRECHLHHATLPPIVTYNAKDEAEARAKGYGDEYIYQEYPKLVGDRTVKSAEEELALLDQMTKAEEKQ